MKTDPILFSANPTLEFASFSVDCSAKYFQTACYPATLYSSLANWFLKRNVECLSFAWFYSR